jgi:hypothetical protein
MVAPSSAVAEAGVPTGTPAAGVLPYCLLNARKSVRSVLCCAASFAGRGGPLRSRPWTTAWTRLYFLFSAHRRVLGASRARRAMFGAPAPALGAGGSLFGAPALATGAGTTTSSFWAPAPAAAGAAGGTSLFGGTPAPAAASGSFFGAPAPVPTGGLFGAPAPAPATNPFGGTNLFGAAPAAAGGSLFGAPAPAPAPLGGCAQPTLPTAERGLRTSRPSGPPCPRISACPGPRQLRR